MEITNHMLAMKMIEEAHSNLDGCVYLFVFIVAAFQLVQLQTIPLATNSGLVLLIFYRKIDETRMVSRQRPHFGAQWILSIARDCNALNYTTRSI
jgi:hypothetical protein